MNKKINKNKYALFHDLVMICIGIVFAYLLVKTGLLDFIVHALRNYYILASFIAGVFFTSAFTIAPSSVALAYISNYGDISGIVIFGALGAMCGDMILFFFIRDRFAIDLMKAMKRSTVKHILHSFHFGFLKYLSPVLGALIIASPIPDEFAMTLMGMSKVRIAILMPLSFLMNSLGIYLLIGFSHML